ncbi:MAG TPA: asparagine synthase-related protein [Gemmatimonadaceae bacterium]
MSGFLALVYTDGRRASRDTLSEPHRILERRGPHGSETWIGDDVACCFTRFISHDGERTQRIISLADGGRLVGHVRVDDRRSLGASSGVESDAALMASLLEVNGFDDPCALLGDYSIATVHPAPSSTALRAWRDPLGVRLLYYVNTGGMIAVSNTIEALLAIPGVGSAIHHGTVSQWLSQGLPSDRTRTWYADVRTVLPGQVLSVSRDVGLTLSTPWRFPDAPRIRYSDARDYPAHFLELLDQAVRARLRTDHAVIFMSGGLDSTSIAAVAARAAADRSHIRCVTSAFTRSVANTETSFARAAAKASGLELDEVDADAFGYLDDWDEVTRRTIPPGEPDFALWHELVRRGARVGTAAMMGYDGDALLQPPGIRSLLHERNPLQAALDVARHLLAHRRRPHLGVRALFQRPQPRRRWPWVIDDEVAQDLGETTISVSSKRPEMYAGLTAPTWQHLFEMIDFGMSGVQLDVRFPLLDRRIIEYVAGVPPIPWCQNKLLLRDAMRPMLPDVVRLRHKQPFTGYLESRLRQLDLTHGRGVHIPVSPDQRLSDFVNQRMLPDALPIEDVDQSLALLRVRELNDWLAAHPSA